MDISSSGRRWKLMWISWAIVFQSCANALLRWTLLRSESRRMQSAFLHRLTGWAWEKSARLVRLGPKSWFVSTHDRKMWVDWWGQIEAVANSVVTNYFLITKMHVLVTPRCSSENVPASSVVKHLVHVDSEEKSARPEHFEKYSHKVRFKRM